MLTFLRRKLYMSSSLEHFYVLLMFWVCVTAWPHTPMTDECPSSRWNVMCRPCCEYHLIQCRCPSTGSKVGYTVPCCRNALDQCDPCIIHPGCSLFENCKTCHNGTWKANDDFFVNGKYCTECRQGWRGGDCKTCGGVIHRSQGHIALESYPTNAHCEWRVHVERGRSVELRFSQLSLESDHLCRYDYVEVRDGNDLNSPVIGRFCGDTVPSLIKSSGNNMHILFISDGYNNFEGFVLTFQESSAIKNPACALPGTLVNGYLLPVYGPKKELIAVNSRCHPPYTLHGSQQRTCLPNGTWNGTDPKCEKDQGKRVQCSPPTKLLNGFYKTTPATAGGAQTIEFSCKKSYILSGNRDSTCLFNGSWSGRLPKCVRACREPKVSELVQQSVVKPHLISRDDSDQRLHRSSKFVNQDILSGGFFPLTSNRKSENIDTAFDELPPGFFPVSTSIDYKCASTLYHHTGSSRRICLKNGRWSGRHVSCSPVCGKFDTPSTHNLTETRLPWHAAIYIRSPPEHTASSHRPPVTAMSHQQGASEESTFWYLACSGALLSQRSILVAAHCVADEDKQQPIQSANVKVLVGMQRQTATSQMKNLHFLRVSDISVHPEFYSAPDSNVAVLKLRDKAKISELVLPVCLPETQGGEVTAQVAYTSRWKLSNDRPSSRSPLSQMKRVELGDVSQCEREFKKGGAHIAPISDNTLCVISKPSSPHDSCSGFIPGITTIPAASPSARGVWTARASAAGWQLLGLESSKETDCHQKTYAIHTKIANFLNWIKEKMK